MDTKVVPEPVRSHPVRRAVRPLAVFLLFGAGYRKIGEIQWFYDYLLTGKPYAFRGGDDPCDAEGWLEKRKITVIGNRFGLR